MRVENSTHSLPSVRRMSDLIRQRERDSAYGLHSWSMHARRAVNSLLGSAVILSPDCSFEAVLNQSRANSKQGGCMNLPFGAVWGPDSEFIQRLEINLQLRSCNHCSARLVRPPHIACIGFPMGGQRKLILPSPIKFRPTNNASSVARLTLISLFSALFKPQRDPVTRQNLFGQKNDMMPLTSNDGNISRSPIASCLPTRETTYKG